ncbi:brain-enriched guanylate kinase-associated protein isoform X2 [Ovis canadensis]|uniref:brain-enriched guanylate kinase-associated protein isoform X2 n=2 Tax=Ovis canadensis TaxID=37174 RepID=UPI003750B5F5
MLSGAGSQTQGPDPGSPRQDGPSSLTEPRAEAPRKEACREDLRGCKPSPTSGRNRKGPPSYPGWGAAQPDQEATKASPGPLSAPELPGRGSRPAPGPLAWLGRRREARLPFSRFLDEVAVRVLDPGTLEAFRGPRGRSPEPSPGEQDPGPAQEALAGTTAPEKILALSPQLSSEIAPEAVSRAGEGRAVETTGLRVGSNKHGGRAASPRRPLGRASAADMEKLSSLQEQKGELRKRLSYTTHRLEKLENEFDSTRHFLEIELRRAQEELEKVTEKLRRIQSNYMALQRINQELEDKLFRMGQHYEEEKRALSHEIVALNSHLLEAKVTIDKLSEDNELYRKDCSLAAQLLQCSQAYGRGRKMAELPAEFQERMNLHAEKPGCSLPAPPRRPAYADSVPPCVLAKVLEKPDPGSLSSHLSEASAQDLGFPEGLEKPGSRPPYKGDIYCSDTALYCPEARHQDRRPSVEGPGSDVGFLQAQNSTDSTAEEEEEEEEDTEAGAAAYPASYRHEAFGGYAASLPTSSSYSSFSAASEEKEHAQASTLTASQQAIYLNSRDELFGRKPPAAYGSSPRYAAAAAAVAAPLEAAMAPGFPRTVSPFPGEPFRFPLSPGPQPALMPPNLWNLRAKPGSARLVAGAGRGQWRPLSVDDIGAYPFPAAAAAPAPSLASPGGGFNDRYFGARGGPGENAEGRASPLYASYKADSFSEGDDLSQGHLVEPRYLRAAGDLSLSPGRSADPLPSYAASEGDRERLGVQLLGASGSPEPELSLRSSRDSLEPSSMEASPEMHPGARLSPQPAFPRAGSSGLSRKDSLTKAQLYGTLLN